MLSDGIRREHPKAAGVPITEKILARAECWPRIRLCGLDGKLVQVW
jgi:hypothetical protein